MPTGRPAPGKGAPPISLSEKGTQSPLISEEEEKRNKFLHNARVLGTRHEEAPAPILCRAKREEGPIEKRLPGGGKNGRTIVRECKSKGHRTSGKNLA